MADNDAGGSPNPVRWLIVAGIATLALAYFPLNELVYLCLGRNAMASVLSVEELRGRRSSGFKVTYRFPVTGGDEQTGSAHWSRSEGPPTDGRARIEYRTFPTLSSRRAGDVDWIGLILFAVAAGGSGFLGVTIFRQAKEFREQERERAERRKRKKRERNED